MKQEDNNVKKTKEQIRAEKKRNASVILFPKQTRMSLNITGYQPEDDIFFLRDTLYMKVYSVDRNTLTEDKKVEFIEKLGEKVMLRLRASSVHKFYGGKGSKLFFLSVFAEGINYTEAYEQFKKFDEDVLESHEFDEISINPCSIEYTMMYIVMNFSGNLKPYNIKESIQKKENWKDAIFPELEEVKELGYKDFEMKRYGVCYRGIEFPAKIDGLYQKICDLGIEFKSCVDFQKLNEQENKMYKKRLEQKYNYHFPEDDVSSLTCATFLFSISADKYEELLIMKDKLLAVFEEQSLIVSPCPEQQKEAYYSIGSLGMLEYRAMRNVNINVISGLPV